MLFLNLILILVALVYADYIVNKNSTNHKKQTTMKKYIIIAAMILTASASAGAAQGYTLTGTNFEIRKTTKAKADTIVTPYTYKGVYQIIMSKKSGAVYVWRTSKKSGKLYKQYLPKDIKEAVQKQMNWTTSK